jgi:hypothetical protein
MFTQQPLSKNVCPGATATFTVAATGTGTLSFGGNGVTINNLIINAGTLTSTSGTMNVSGN